MTQSLLTFDSKDRTLQSGATRWKVVEQYYYLLWFCSFFKFPWFVIFENLSILDLALSGMKGLNPLKRQIHVFYVSISSNSPGIHDRIHFIVAAFPGTTETSALNYF